MSRVPGFVSVAIVCAVLLGCDRRVPPEKTAAESAPPAQVPASSPPPAVSEPAKPFRFPLTGRLVAIGDVHGDLNATRAALRLAGAIDDSDHWIGGSLVVVQTGDQLDRGDQERAILDLLERLSNEARKAGGALHVLNGNHELMNVAGDFRYVTQGGFAEFSNVSAAGRAGALAKRFPEANRGRVAAFAPSGEYAMKLADRNTVIVVGETVFAHGGVLPEHIKYGIGRINSEVSRFMRGELGNLSETVEGPDSPVWSRHYGESEPSAAACASLSEVLRELKAKRLVIGHTVQKKGITSACGERVFRIDVGLAAYYGNNPAQVLEIENGKVRVLSAADATAPAPIKKQRTKERAPVHAPGP